jgi:hypothetical protein
MNRQDAKDAKKTGGTTEDTEYTERSNGKEAHKLIFFWPPLSVSSVYSVVPRLLSCLLGELGVLAVQPVR